MAHSSRRASAVVWRCFALWVVLLAAVLAPAQTTLYQPGSPLFLWKVSSATNSAYLFGSLHVAMPSFYPLPAEMERAYADSNVLVVEVDMSKVDMAKLQQLTMQLGSYPAGDDLSRHLKPETAARVQQFCRDSGLPWEAVSQLRPWLVALLVTQRNLSQQGYDEKLGLDRHFMENPGKHRVEELETAEQQLRLIAEPTGDDPDLQITHVFDYAARQKEITARMVDAWGHGEPDKLDALVAEFEKEETPGERAQMHRLNAERNPNMAAHLEKCLASGDHCFMVIGALHATGKDGVLSLLQAKGYKIEQIKMAAEKK